MLLTILPLGRDKAESWRGWSQGGTHRSLADSLEIEVKEERQVVKKRRKRIDEEE